MAFEGNLCNVGGGLATTPWGQGIALNRHSAVIGEQGKKVRPTCRPIPVINRAVRRGHRDGSCAAIEGGGRDCPERKPRRSTKGRHGKRLGRGANPDEARTVEPRPELDLADLRLEGQLELQSVIGKGGSGGDEEKLVPSAGREERVRGEGSCPMRRTLPNPGPAGGRRDIGSQSGDGRGGRGRGNRRGGS